MLPPLRSFLLLPFQANVSCVGYQRESTQLRFLKGVVESATLYTAFIRSAALYWPPLHNRTLKVNYSFSYLYYQTLLQFIITRYTILLCGVKSSAKFVVIREQWTISRPILKKKWLNFFLYHLLHIFLYICIFSHKKKSFKFMRDYKNIINHYNL